MATHKAATAVTIAPVAEKSALAALVDRYWKMAVLLALAVTASILYLQHQKTAKRSEDDQSWDRVLAVANEDRFSRTLSGNAADLQSVASQVKGKQAGAWALFLAATSAAEDQDPEAAQKALADLRSQYPSHSLLTGTYTFPGSETPASAVDTLQKRVDALAAWKTANPGLFVNPELPADAPKVRIHTDLGDVVVGLYANEAPKHVENFLKLAREGYYSATKFHRVIPGFMIQGGDPNTIQGEASTWGQGGPDYKIARELNSLKHFPGYLAAAKKGGETESSGSQFYITVAPAHHLDGEHVVFGKVIEGMDIVHAIEKAPLDPKTQDRPLTPPTIRSMEVLGG
ncbi:MAG: peptidylprolyl isomerase [Planctomycetota bacterium]|nr:peptidylprolyl isomerase [Planctomycetota bacterium]